MAHHRLVHVLFTSMVFLTGCGTLARVQDVTNKPESITPQDQDLKTSFDIKADRGSHEKTLVLLALSGGGSRAAYWSGSVMLALEKVYQDDNLNLLKEVDLISSVSGGSLPAAYYAISQDPGSSVKARSNRNWDDPTVKKLMSKSYIWRWFGNWFWPENILYYWFTSYDRSDIMASTLADNLYDIPITGVNLKVRDINPERPNLILNATNATNAPITPNGSKRRFGDVFTFTTEDFKGICSDIGSYDLSRAVMATASFPAVFNYMTLGDYSEDGKCSADRKLKRYVHVFDGGNYDNLGLASVERAIAKNKILHKYERIVVILVDAYTSSRGIDTASPDARRFLDYAVDFNFLDSTDSLLGSVRDKAITNMGRALQEFEKSKVIFYRIDFDAVKEANHDLYYRLNNIATNFKIDDDAKESIDQAIAMLIVKDNTCLRKIKDIVLLGQSDNNKSIECQWHPE